MRYQPLTKMVFVSSQGETWAGKAIGFIRNHPYLTGALVALAVFGIYRSAAHAAHLIYQNEVVLEELVGSEVKPATQSCLAPGFCHQPQVNGDGTVTMMYTYSAACPGTQAGLATYDTYETTRRNGKLGYTTKRRNFEATGDCKT